MYRVALLDAMVRGAGPSTQQREEKKEGSQPTEADTKALKWIMGNMLY